MRGEQNRKPPLTEGGQMSARAEALSDKELDAVSGGRALVIKLDDLLAGGQNSIQFGIDKGSPLGGM